MNIQTDFNVFWHAWDDDEDAETAIQGHGTTERAAINNLVEKLVERALEAE